MALRLIQTIARDGARGVIALSDGAAPRLVAGAESVYDLAMRAIARGATLVDTIAALGFGETVDVGEIIAERRALAPLDHPDPARMLISGTGLTHLGSAEGRDAMHRELAEPAKLTDSMRMFKLGLEGGKPAAGAIGAQPEWFYKGDASIVVAPEHDLPAPGFGLDCSEEPEIVGLYVIGADGAPWRVGFALGNEASDHVTERQNYLYLAHSKLRPCSFGPELLVGDLPDEVRGVSRIRRGGAVLWEKEFLSGEAHMCHSLANLEAHHFKYAQFRRPGDAHAHFFGTATLSFSAGVRTEDGDVFEIEADAFSLPLRNRLGRAGDAGQRARAL